MTRPRKRRATVPLPPDVLASTLQDRVHPTSGRLLKATLLRRAQPLPCTCGGAAKVAIHHGSAWVWCADDSCERSVQRDNIGSAVKHWNARVTA